MTAKGMEGGELNTAFFKYKGIKMCVSGCVRHTAEKQKLEEGIFG